MTEQNTQKSELIGNGWKVSVIIEGGKVQVVIDDRTMKDGITVVDMYHNDDIMRIGTDHIVRDTIRDYATTESNTTTR